MDPDHIASAKTDPLALYETMLLLRVFEDELYRLFLRGEVPGTLHLYQGQEAIATGVCAHLDHQDVLLAPHRPHGHGLAKGIDPAAMMAEILGKASGCCKGKGGSMHVGDWSVGMPPALAIVGAGIPIAAGAALGFQMRAEDRVAVSMFGDSATNTGAFHEGLTLAAVWQLPVVFVCENNLYGVSTDIRQASRLTNLADHAASYDIPSQVLDGNDVLAVSSAAEQAIHQARSGGGPSLLEAKTYRHGGHSRTDPGTYRPEEEVKAWKERDPVVTFRRALLDEHLASEADLLELEGSVHDQISEAIAFARKSPYPTGSSALEDVWAISS